MLNWRRLPALKFSPKELLLGLVVNTANTPIESSSSMLTPADVNKHFTYAAQQRLDGYAEAVNHAIRRKATFDRKVLKSAAGIVTFSKGQLVQVYRSDLMNTLSTDRKLQPTWSGPYRVHEQLLNSYKLEELDGMLKTGEFSARRLRAFTPREGTDLARAQITFEEELARKEAVSGAGNTGEAAGGGLINNLGVIESGDDGTGTGEDADGGSDHESNIASRVVGRRGRRQKGGGRMD